MEPKGNSIELSTFFKYDLMEMKKSLGTAFFIEQFRWLFFNYVLLSDRIFKKKVSGEIAFDLTSLFHVQNQEPTCRSTTTRAFVFLAKFAEFYYHKIFEERGPKRLLG